MPNFTYNFTIIQHFPQIKQDFVSRKRQKKKIFFLPIFFFDLLHLFTLCPEITINYLITL